MNTNLPQALTLIPANALEEIMRTLSDIKNQLGQSKKEDQDEYVQSSDVPNLLRISARTWQSYRDKKMIPVIRIGGKIWVKRSDLDKFMQEHYIK